MSKYEYRHELEYVLKAHDALMIDFRKLELENAQLKQLLRDLVGCVVCPEMVATIKAKVGVDTDAGI